MDGADGLVQAVQMDLQPVSEHSISLHPAHLQGCQCKEHGKGGGIQNASPESAHFATFTNLEEISDHWRDKD